MLNTSTLRPGYLVSLKSCVKGNVSYEKTVTEPEHITSDGAEEAEWTTKKRIDVPDEHKAATKTRSKARALVASVCSWTSFGLLCPEDRIEDLRAAVIAAQEMAAAFNAGAQLSRIEVSVIAGRVLQDDVQAVEAINREVRDLMGAMQDGIRKMDPDAIRAAATQARGLGQMLSEDAKKRVQDAINVARATAKEIVKAGETAAKTVDEEALKAIARARHAFLDLDQQEAEVAAPGARGRAVMFETEADAVAARERAFPTRQIDLGEDASPAA